MGHLVAEVLFDQDIKRGPLPSSQEREARVRRINQLMSKTCGGLQMALLVMPVRDRNPAKNDGPYPDLGEAVSVLRLWTIAESIRIARAAYLAERDALLEDFRKGASLEPWTLRASLAPASCQEEDSKRLHHALKQKGLSSDGLLSALDVSGQGTIRMFAVRDSKRYPCFATDPEEDLSAYKKGLDYLVRALDVSPMVQVVDIEDLMGERKGVELEGFRKKVEAVYREKLEAGMALLGRLQKDLLMADGRTAFREQLKATPESGPMGILIEPIIHGRWHPELAHLGPRERLEFLGRIFDTSRSIPREAMRQSVLKSSLGGAVQYVAAYEANTQTRNNQGLDDIEFLLPGSLRLSIHQKPEACGQFTIRIGPNVHMTPWHGTAVLRGSTHGDSISWDTRRSIELKHEESVPVLIQADDGLPVPETLAAMAKIGQPLVWISRDLASLLADSGVGDGDAMIQKVATKRVSPF